MQGSSDRRNVHHDAEITQSASDAQAQNATCDAGAKSAIDPPVAKPILVNEKLKALRKRSGMSAPALAAALNLPHSTYKSWEDRPRSVGFPVEKMQALARVVVGHGQPPIAERDVLSLSGVETATVTYTSEANARIAETSPLPAREMMLRDVPVFGTAAGSGGEGAFLMNWAGGPIDYIRRPPGIAAARGVFAIYVENDSMAPRYEPGEPVYCDPHKPPAIGSYVVVVLDGEAPGDPPQAFLKRLVRRTASELICEQFNPPREIRFPTARIKQIARVLDWRDLTGV